MTFRILLVIALSALCTSLSAAALFGYAPDEAVGDSQDQIQHALGKIQKLASNFKRMAGNAQADGNKLLQALRVQSNDPEALLALVTETKLAISQSAPAGVDISSCESGNDQKYQAMVQEAGPGIEACLHSAAAVLQPYFQHLDDLVTFAQDAAVGANANVTSCVNKNQGNDGGLTDCLSVVRNQVFDGRDQLMAAILGVMADFRSGTGPLVADFTKCTNDVQDRAIGESVDIIQSTRECFKGLGVGVSSRNSTSSV
ncbi:uncharacterized protein LOC111874939 [Cryptotermes secundus]|nr:uncharacterized protein LOC111874939 [Cryptotermes secundus]